MLDAGFPTLCTAKHMGTWEHGHMGTQHDIHDLQQLDDNEDNAYHIVQPAHLCSTLLTFNMDIVATYSQARQQIILNKLSMIPLNDPISIK
jgi:hypothetical protein